MMDHSGILHIDKIYIYLTSVRLLLSLFHSSANFVPVELAFDAFAHTQMTVFGGGRATSQAAASPVYVFRRWQIVKCIFVFVFIEHF